MVPSTCHRRMAKVCENCCAVATQNVHKTDWFAFALNRIFYFLFHFFPYFLVSWTTAYMHVAPGMDANFWWFSKLCVLCSNFSILFHPPFVCSSGHHQITWAPRYFIQCKRAMRAPITTRKRKQRHWWYQTKISPKRKSFHPNVRFYDAFRHISPQKITLSKQITDTFVSIFIRFAIAAPLTPRPPAVTTFCLWIAHVIQMNTQTQAHTNGKREWRGCNRTFSNWVCTNRATYTSTHRSVCCSRAPTIRMQKDIPIHAFYPFELRA